MDTIKRFQVYAHESSHGNDSSKDRILGEYETQTEAEHKLRQMWNMEMKIGWGAVEFGIKFRPEETAPHGRKRLQSELMTMMMKTEDGISAFPVEATIVGVEGTVYEGLEFKLSLKFSQDYPYVPPIVKFLTPCFHPNIDQHGNICLDLLNEKWSAAYNISAILVSIQSLLGDPNIESPLNGYAAVLWDNKEEYKKVLIASCEK